MAGIEGNIYPPIFLKPYMPAFIKNSEGCRIYFSLSMFNSIDSISQYVQIIVQSQNTNFTALNREQYPTGIKLASLTIDTDRTTDDKYYVVITDGDMEGRSFNPGEFYKVQLRFMSPSAGLPTEKDENGKPKEDTTGNLITTTKIDQEWLLTNLGNFSQWSQICLIKELSSVPQIKIKDLVENVDKLTYTLKDIYISGRIILNAKDKEYLKQYRIYLYDNSGLLIEDSNFIYSNKYNNVNEISYKIKYNLENDNYYILKIAYMTNNLYEGEITYEIYIDLVQFTTLDGSKYSISAYSKANSGVIQVELKGSTIINQLGTNFIIRRTSNETNFKVWEDMHTFLAETGKTLNKVWQDRTVQSGIWYKYSFQRRDPNDFRSNSLQTESAVMAMFDDIYLLDDMYQLRVRFDPQITNFSHVVSESSTQTIGSKFPFIRRNGNVDYRTFTLSGTITHFMDTKENGMKASPSDIYGSNLEMYEGWNSNHNITPYNDSVYEKKFRDKVIKFLYENKVKLYKSTTEGNILVKLMNISFTPNNQLSRHIYGFTCTAYQVDQFNVENCIKYGILNAGAYSALSQRLYFLPGQIESPTTGVFYATGYYQKANGIVQIPKANFIDNNNQSIDYLKESSYENRMISTEKSNYPTFEAETNLIKSRILPQYKKFENDLVNINIDYLTSFKIEFTSPPYAIGVIGGRYQKIKNDNDYHNINANYSYQPQIFTGHLIRVNNSEPILVGPEGIYEVTDDNIKITDIKIVETEETGLITYIAHFVQTVKSENIPKAYYNYKKVGQLYNYFSSSESIYKRILLRYKQNKTSTDKNGKQILLQRTNVQHVMGIRVTANPHTMIAVREDQDAPLSYKYAEIGESGVLQFYDQETNIKGLYILGPHLVQIPYDESREPREGEYMVCEGEFNDFNSIPNPKDKCVYNIVSDEALMFVVNRLSLADLDNLYRFTAIEEKEIKQADIDTAYLVTRITNSLTCIYYHGGWYAFSKAQGIVYGYPTEAMVDYYCQILREVFQG